MSGHGEAEKMYHMNEWLVKVCSEFGIDPGLLDDVVPALLELTRDVAHGPSRPGAPLTAFLVGVAAAGGVDKRELAPGVIARATRVREMVAQRAPES